MKKMVLAAGMLIALSVDGPGAAEYPWVLKKNAHGIEVHVRKVEHSPILEYKGKMILDARLEEVLAFYENEKRMPEWFHQCMESKLLKVRSSEDKILYFAIDLPWPLKDRDAVYRRVRSQDPVTGVVEYAISAYPEDFLQESGRIRMPYLKGLWRFTPLEEGRTEVYYQQHGDAGGHIPIVLVNQLAVNIPFNSFLNFRRLFRQ